MFQTIKALLGINPVDYAELVRRGAIILDVRSREEYAVGHVAGAVNISVDTLSENLQKLRNKEVAVITCCESGMRSARAKRILDMNGYSNVHNAGSWRRLQQKIS